MHEKSVHNMSRINQQTDPSMSDVQRKPRKRHVFCSSEGMLVPPSLGLFFPLELVKPGSINGSTTEPTNCFFVLCNNDGVVLFKSVLVVLLLHSSEHKIFGPPTA